MPAAAIIGAKHFAKVGSVEPHYPVHTERPFTCGTCGHAIGWTAQNDPVHAVERPCAGQCGKMLAPFHTHCASCERKLDEQRERERQARLAEYKPEAEVELGPDGERRRQRDEEPEVDPLRKARFNEAVAYIRSYIERVQRGEVYRPWGLILDLVAKPQWDTKYFRLTDRQVEVLLDAKKRDEQYAKERAERKASGIDLNVLPAGTTHYAVDNFDGEVTFLKVDRVTTGKWAGWVFVKQVLGGGSEHPLGKQRPGDSYTGTFERLIRKVLENPLEAARRYGLELGICSDCGRTLTNAESREYGIGPVCRGKWESAA